MVYQNLTSFGVSEYSFIRSTDTTLLSRSLVTRTIQFSSEVTCNDKGGNIYRGKYRKMKCDRRRISSYSTGQICLFKQTNKVLIHCCKSHIYVSVVHLNTPYAYIKFQIEDIFHSRVPLLVLNESMYCACKRPFPVPLVEVANAPTPFPFLVYPYIGGGGGGVLFQYLRMNGQN